MKVVDARLAEALERLMAVLCAGGDPQPLKEEIARIASELTGDTKKVPRRRRKRNDDAEG